MIDHSNKIFTKVKNSINHLIEGAGQTFQETPSEFPFMYFNQIDNSNAHDDLDNNENATNTSIEITIYTKGNIRLTTAKNIMKVVCQEMNQLGFRRMFGPREVTNVSDTAVCRYIARFNRIIGSEDII